MKKTFLQMFCEGIGDGDGTPIENLNEEFDDEKFTNMVVDFLITIDPDTLDEEAQDLYYDLMDYLDGLDIDMDDSSDEDGVIEEGEGAIKKKRIEQSDKRDHRKFYRQNKQKLKMKQARYRKTAAYQRYKKKKKRMDKLDKTTTGKRKVSYY